MQALCVKFGDALLIDLRPLPLDPARITNAIGTIGRAAAKSQVTTQAWVASAEMLDAFFGNTTELDALLSALISATGSSKAALVVEPGEPQPAIVYLLQSAGLAVVRPPLYLNMIDGEPVDVLAELAKMRNR